MKDLIVVLLMGIGSAFMVLAGVGILRMPDLFTRMQTSTKSTTLGLGCMLLAVAIYHADFWTILRSILIVGFLFLTTPVAAHIVARASYFVRGVELWEGSIVDELKDRYDPKTHVLSSYPLDHHQEDRQSQDPKGGPAGNPRKS